MITQKQHDLFRFVETYIKTHDGVAPSFTEMRIAMNLASNSGIHRILTALENRGFIFRIKDKARSIQIIRSLDQDPSFDHQKTEAIRKICHWWNNQGCRHFETTPEPIRTAFYLNAIDRLSLTKNQQTTDVQNRQVS